MKFLQRFLLKFLLPAFCFAGIFSCSSPKNINETFEQKFGKKIEKIKAERTPPKSSKNEITSSPAPVLNDLHDPDSSGQNKNYYAYVDVTKFDEKTPQYYFPNGESYEQEVAKNPSNSLPQNMFDVSYNTALYPPFRRIGAEFDRIEVPEKDAYGVKTAMSEKPYLLAGNDSLQKNIDQIISEKNADEIEFSETLIREQKQLKRKEKMVKIFGRNSVELVSLSEPTEDQKENPEKKSQPKTTTESTKKESENNQQSASSQDVQAPMQGVVIKN